MKYFVLAKEDLTNKVERRVIANNTTFTICNFLLEKVVYRYGIVGKIVAERGELDAHKAIKLFARSSNDLE